MSIHNLPTPWPCAVHIYGNDYPGQIVSWGKTKVMVRFRMKSGDKEPRERRLPVATLARPKNETYRTFVTPNLPHGFSGGYATPHDPDRLAHLVLNTSLMDLVTAQGRYRPTIMLRHAADLAIADAYDRAQVERGDARRAFRGSKRVVR